MTQLATLEALTAVRTEDVETPAGIVRVQSSEPRKVLAHMDREPADQAAHLIALCVVEPAMTLEQAQQLPVGIMMQLGEAIMRVNGAAQD
jgi:hypothetical protein